MPVLEPIVVTSGIDWLVDHVRKRINDPKAIHTFEIQENAGSATGAAAGEIFLTQNMPISSGFERELRIGRWYYTEKDTIAETSGVRGYVFNVASGSYYVPSGATAATSGDTVKLSYAWNEEQPYRFSDDELKNFLQAAVTEVQQGYYDFSFVASGIGSAWSLAPEPGANNLGSYVFAMYTVYLIKKKLEEEGFQNRLVVRDNNVAIDLAKGLGELTKSSKELFLSFKDIVRALKINGQESAFSRVDTYSTKPPAVKTGPWGETWQSNYRSDDQFF